MLDLPAQLNECSPEPQLIQGERHQLRLTAKTRYVITKARNSL
jgi:hypothetical protein